MAREAKLFDSVKGSPVRALVRLNANIRRTGSSAPGNPGRGSNPDIVQTMKKLKRLREKRPRAHATIRAAGQELKVLLKAWELAYRKESFYNACVRCSRSAGAGRASADVQFSSRYGFGYHSSTHPRAQRRRRKLQVARSLRHE